MQETQVLFLCQKIPGEVNGNPLQYSCLENPTDRRAWQATVLGVARVRHDLQLNHHDTVLCLACEYGESHWLILEC